MAFSINPALTHVPIEEPHLHEVFRSTSTAVVKMTGGRSCEAFICTSRKNNRYAVFVSLLDTVTKTIHVMTTDEQDLPADAYRTLLEEAKMLLADLGFELEKVNIDFSAAIRQVVIRDIRVMHPPPRNRVRISRGQMRQAQEEGAPADTAPAAGVAAAAVAAGAAAVAVVPAKAAVSVPDVASLRDEICRLRRDGLHLEKALKGASAELEALRAGKAQAEAELLEMRDALLRETVAASRASAEAAATGVALAEKVRLLEEELAAVRTKQDVVEEPAAHDEVEKLKGEMESLIAHHRREADRLEATRREADEEREILQRKLREIEEKHRDVVLSSEMAAERINALEEELAAAKRESEPPPEVVDPAELGLLKREMEALVAKHREECDRLDAKHAEAVAEAGDLRRELLDVQEKYLGDTVLMRAAVEEGDLARNALSGELERVHARHEEELSRQGALLQSRDEEIRGLKEDLRRAQSDRLAKGEVEAAVAAAAEAARVAAETELTRLREEVRSLRAENEAESLATAVEVELLRRKGAEAEQTLAHLQEEHRRLTVERPTLLAAARKAKRLQTEIQRLREEQRVHGDRLPARGHQKIEEVSAAKPEAAMLMEAEPVIEMPMPTVVVTPDNELPEGADIADSLALLLADGAGYAPANFGSAAVEFRIDHRLHDVEYESDDDVVAVYEAMNNVQAMPGGGGMKKCGAYICVVRRAGKRHVYNVWTLVDQGTALVAVPSRQEGEEGAESVLKDALFYFESVGFIMEPLELGNTRQKRSRALSRVSVLRKNSPEVAGSVVPAREHAHASR